MNDLNQSEKTIDGVEREGRPRKKRRKKRPLRTLLIIIGILILAVIVMHTSYFDIRGIAVVGNSEIEDEEIVELSEIDDGECIFDVWPSSVEKKIKKNLYIKDVKVKRKLPSEIEIKVKERSCRAQLPMSGGFAVIGEDGMVIEISKEETRATLAEGIHVEKAEGGKYIEVKEEGRLSKTCAFIETAEKADLYFKKLVFKGDGEIDAYVFDRLKCSGKYADIVSAMNSGTLKSVIYDLYQKDKEKGTVKVYDNDYCFFTTKE